MSTKRTPDQKSTETTTAIAKPSAAKAKADGPGFMIRQEKGIEAGQEVPV